MKRTSILAWSPVAAVVLSQSRAAAQNVVEIRAADTKYRYVDWNYPFRTPAVVDVFYVGVPGSNEFNLGGGYAFKRGPPLVKVNDRLGAWAVSYRFGCQKEFRVGRVTTF